MSAALFRRVRKPCTGRHRWGPCRRIVETLAYVPRPMCRPCRRRLAVLRTHAGGRAA